MGVEGKTYPYVGVSEGGEGGVLEGNLNKKNGLLEINLVARFFLLFLILFIFLSQ